MLDFHKITAEFRDCHGAADRERIGRGDRGEIASILAITAETVRARLHRARNMLRERLGEQFAAVLKDVFPFERPRCDARVSGRLGKAGSISTFMKILLFLRRKPHRRPDIPLGKIRHRLRPRMPKSSSGGASRNPAAGGPAGRGFFIGEVDSDTMRRMMCALSAQAQVRAVLQPGAARHWGKFGEPISRTLISPVSAAPRP